MRIGIFGGSFDPIHRGHVKLAEAARRQLKLSRVYFVVAPRSPFKVGENKTAPLDRLRLVKLAVRGRAGLTAADWEIRRAGLSYTVTTLRAYHRAHPRHDVFLILGTDAVAGFSRWREARTILRLAALVVGRRPGAAWPRLPPPLGTYARLKGTFPNVSSTALRAALAAGRRPKGMDAAVMRAVRARGLYR